MPMLSWFARRPARPLAAPRAASLRPRLECLEARDVPAAGALDPTFGTGGVVSFPFGFTDALKDIALQPDGKIVAGGSVQVTGLDQDFALARFNPDGSLDTTFGDAGRVRTDFGPDYSDEIQALAVLPGGKILAVGNIGGTASVGLARYNPDGTLDTTFGPDGTGRAAVDFSLSGFETAFALAVLPDGRFVVAGGVQPNPSASQSFFAVARFHADGSLDPTFGTGGVVSTDFGPTDAGAFGVVVQADGKVVAAGQSSSSSANFSFAVARYNTDGTPDTTFAGTGQLQIEFGPDTNYPTGRDVALQADGKIVVAGIFLNGGSADIGVARLNPDGTLDATFGGGDGLASIDAGSDEDGHAVAIEPGGKIVVAGLWTQPGGSNSFVARLNPDGSPDTGFGTAGTVVTDVAANDNDEFNAVLIQPDGKILTAGTAGAGSIRQFGLARYDGGSAANRPPVAVADTAVLNTGTAVTIAVLANDTDPDGDPLRVTGVTQPAGGRAVVTVNADGTVTYTQTVYATGTARFTYTVSDGRGGTATATVRVTLAIPPAVGIDMLRSQVAALDLTAAEKRSLTRKLDAASDALARGNEAAARAKLSAFLVAIDDLADDCRIDAATARRFESQVEALDDVLS